MRALTLILLPICFGVSISTAFGQQQYVDGLIQRIDNAAQDGEIFNHQTGEYIAYGGVATMFGSAIVPAILGKEVFSLGFGLGYSGVAVGGFMMIMTPERADAATLTDFYQTPNGFKEFVKLSAKEQARFYNESRSLQTFLNRVDLTISQSKNTQFANNPAIVTRAKNIALINVPSGSSQAAPKDTNEGNRPAD